MLYGLFQGAVVGQYTGLLALDGGLVILQVGVPDEVAPDSLYLSLSLAADMIRALLHLPEVESGLEAHYSAGLLVEVVAG